MLIIFLDLHSDSEIENIIYKSNNGKLFSLGSDLSFTYVNIFSVCIHAHQNFLALFK